MNTIVNSSNISQYAWRNNQNFPSNTSHGYCALVSRNKTVSGYTAAKTAAEAWQPFSRVLVGTSDSDVLLPPVCIPEFLDIVRIGYRRKIRISMLMLCFMFLFTIAITITTHNVGRTFNITLLIALIFTFVALDEFVFLCKDENLCDRGKYLVWLQNHRSVRSAFLVVVGLNIFLGICQIVAERYFGSTDLLIAKFGIVYADLAMGQWWRLFSGPFIHASLQHFFVNASLGLIIIPFVYLYFGWWTFFIFIAGCVSGSTAQWVINPFSDALTGVSGGLFALCAAAFAVCLFCGSRTPKGFSGQVASIGVISIFGAYILNPATASVSHVFGYIVGFISAVILIRATMKEGLMN